MSPKVQSSAYRGVNCALDYERRRKERGQLPSPILTHRQGIESAGDIVALLIAELCDLLSKGRKRLPEARRWLPRVRDTSQVETHRDSVTALVSNSRQHPEPSKN